MLAKDIMIIYQHFNLCFSIVFTRINSQCRFIIIIISVYTQMKKGKYVTSAPNTVDWPICTTQCQSLLIIIIAVNCHIKSWTLPTERLWPPTLTCSRPKKALLLTKHAGHFALGCQQGSLGKFDISGLECIGLFSNRTNPYSLTIITVVYIDLLHKFTHPHISNHNFLYWCK